MSMDVAIWVTCLVTLPSDLPQSEKWQMEQYEGFTSYTYMSPKMDWQLILEKLEESELPMPETKSLNPEVKHGYAFALEPIGASSEGYELLEQSVQSLADSCGGGVVEGPAGISVIDAKS